MRSFVLWQFRLEAWFEDLDAGAVTSVSFALAAPSDHAAGLDFSTPDFVVWPQSTARMCVCVCLCFKKSFVKSTVCAQRAHFQNLDWRMHSHPETRLMQWLRNCAPFFVSALRVSAPLYVR